MALCVVCKREKARGEKQYAYTGKYLWSSESTTMNPVGPFSTTTVSKTAYTDFMKHELFVCSDCNRKESILMKLILIPTLLLAACSGAVALIMNDTTTGAWLCGGSFAIFFLGCGILWILQDVVFKIDIDGIIKKEAILQRSVNGETGINAFSESEYNGMLKPS